MHSKLKIAALAFLTRNVLTTFVFVVFVFALSAAGPALATGLSSPEAPNIWSLLPPVLAITAAVIFRQVIPALFAGLWLGAWFISGATPLGLGTSFLASFEVYIVGAIADADHAALISFILMIGAMVGIISKNGGLHGIVTVMTRWATNKKRAQLGTGFLGLAIFFDDYANTLIVGNTMRPVTDYHKISREKLAYLVDSTAAPVACLALISTWVGYEVGLIDAATRDIEGLGDPYLIFLNSLAYSFYPLLAIFFVFLVASTGQDYGPMKAAEQAAAIAGEGAGASSGATPRFEKELAEIEPDRDMPHRAINALAPIGVLLAGVVGGLLASGEGDNIRDIVASANSYQALLWGSLLGTATAGSLSVAQRLMTLDEAVLAGIGGIEKLVYPVLILVLAWSLAKTTQQLGTADYLIATLSEAIPVQVMPALIFVISAATAFATGSSWGVMGILMPLAIPLVAAQISVDGVIDPAQLAIFYSSVACVLAGSVWGDHCSPISDTTILSSMTSGCDHIAHVRTQMPYALLVGAVAILAGTLPAGFGLPWWVGLALGAGLLVMALRVLARPVRA